MKISTIALTQFRNDLHFQFQSDFGALVGAFGAAALKVAPQYAQWQARFALEDEALKKIAASSLTKRIHDADRARDNTFAGMVEIVHAYLKYYDAQTAEAARRVKIVLDTYGNIAKKPMREQTSAVHNLLQELRGTFAADCLSVRVDAWVSRLAVENNAVISLMGERVSEFAAKTDVVLRDARRDVDESFKQICEIINVYVLLEGASAYEPFIRPLNELIKEYAQRHRHHRADGDPDPAQDAPESEDETESAV